MCTFEASMRSIISHCCSTTEVSGSILKRPKLKRVVSWRACKDQHLIFLVNSIQALELRPFNYFVIAVLLVKFQYRLPICACGTQILSGQISLLCVFLEPQLASMCDRNVRKGGDESLQWHCVQRPGTVNSCGLWEVVLSFHMAAFLMTLFGAPCLCGSIAGRPACLIAKLFVLFFFPAPAYQSWLLSSRTRTSDGGREGWGNIGDWDPICVLSTLFAGRKYVVFLS